MPIYRDIYDGPPRWHTARATAKRYVMIHATANDASAEDEASFAKRRDSRVSSHYYVDDNSIVQSLNTDFRAWHAGNVEGNDSAIAYELTARNMNVGRSWWLDHGNIEWPLLRAAIARDCQHHGIEPRPLTDAQLRAGRMTGIITHVQGNRVWGGSSHHDPGPNFPMDHLVEQVKRAMGDDDVSWSQRIEHRPWVPRTWPVYEGGSTAESALSATLGFARHASERSAEVLAGQAAILAAVQGRTPDEVTQAIRAELDRHRTELLDELGDDFADRIAARFAEPEQRDAEQVRQVVREELDATVLARRDDDSEG